MNARLAATLALLCGYALAGPAANPGPAAPAASPAPAHGTVRPARAAEPPPPAPAPAAPAPSDRALMLAGLALMAGIALRRLGDGSP